MDRREGAKAVLEACRTLLDGESCRSKVEMEKKQREWIWEYVLKHCTDHSVIEELMKVYQIPNDNLVLKRMLFLRTLSLQLTEPLLPDAVVDVLHGLKELGKPGSLSAAGLVALARNSPIRAKRRRGLESDEGGGLAKRGRSVAAGIHQQPGVPAGPGPGPVACQDVGGIEVRTKGPDMQAGAGGTALDEQISETETAAAGPPNSPCGPAEDARKKRVLPKSLAKGFGKFRDATRSSFLNEDTYRKGKEKFLSLFPNRLGIDPENGEKGRDLDLGAQAFGSSDDLNITSSVKDCTLCHVQAYQPPDRTLLLAVMIELSVQHLRDESMDLQRYREAMHKHWGASVEDTEDQVEDDKGIFQAVKAALWDALELPDLRNKIVKEHKREDMEKILKAFLHQAWSEIGPTFLERIAEGEEQLSRQGVYGENTQNVGRVGPEVASRSEEDEARVMQVVQGMGQDQRRQAYDEQGNSHVEMHNPENRVETGCLEAHRAIQNLRESEIQLYSMVKDPLPQALQLANQVGGDVETFRNRGQPGTADGEISLNKSPLNLQPSVEWIEEDISDSPEQNIPPRIVLQRPAANKFAPLVRRPFDSPPKVQRPAANKFAPLVRSPFDSPPKVQARRRMRRKWTEVEETTLKVNVQKYGKGRWKFILKNNMDVFTTRTEVDLKDKWRNIEKAEGIFLT